MLSSRFVVALCTLLSFTGMSRVYDDAFVNSLALRGARLDDRVVISYGYLEFLDDFTTVESEYLEKALSHYGKFSEKEESGYLMEAFPVEVSAYTASKREGTENGITASGDKARSGFIAASRDLVKLYGYGRTVHVYEKGDDDDLKLYGTFVLKDTMHKRYSNTLDIFMNRYEDAMRFGRRKMFAVVE